MMTGKNWLSVPLSEVIKHRKEFIQIDDLTTYKRCRVQLHAQGIVLRDSVLGSEIKTKKQQVCYAGEFLVAEIDAKVGGFGIVPESLEAAIVSSHYFLFTLDEKSLDRRFLDYFIRTRYFRDQVMAQGSTNYAAIRSEDVLGYTIPLPLLDEQRRIVARIEGLAARIEEARELRRRAAVEAEALLKSGMNNLFAFSNLDFKPISQLITIKGGGTPSKSNPYYWEGTIPWISPKDMKTKEITDSIDHISENAAKESTAKLLDPGAVLIVVRGMILARMVPSAILRVPAAINQDMKALIPSKAILPEYLCGALWAFSNQILELVEKSTHDTRKLETSKLLDFRIPVPSPDQQQIVVCHLNKLQSKLDALKCHQAETAAELDAFMPAVLERAFRGEL
jgi:type I restriction enzyme, S subunit